MIFSQHTEHSQSLQTDSVPDPDMGLTLPPVVARPLARGHSGLVGVECQTLDILGMCEVVTLGLLLHVVQHHHARHEVDHLAWEEQTLLDILSLSYNIQLLISLELSENVETKTNYILQTS